jgi:hypothetical protein
LRRVFHRGGERAAVAGEGQSDEKGAVGEEGGGDVGVTDLERKHAAHEHGSTAKAQRQSQ